MASPFFAPLHEIRGSTRIHDGRLPCLTHCSQTSNSALLWDGDRADLRVLLSDHRAAQAGHNGMKDAMRTILLPTCSVCVFGRTAFKSELQSHFGSSASMTTAENVQRHSNGPSRYVQGAIATGSH